MAYPLARRRLQLLREERRVSQEALARALGFNDRQTLSAIELGERLLKPAELVAAARYFGVELDYFTDPFELAGEGRFSWRQQGASLATLDRVEAKAGRWLAAYRHLSRLKGEKFHSLQLRVAIDSASSYEDAAAEGEAIAAELNLGEVPARDLIQAIEEDLGTLVLHMDEGAGISGAACRLNEMNAILINRRESAARRAFDLAHELFHLLTWDTLPPDRSECYPPTGRSSRVEKLAENFAAGLLVPSRRIEARLKSGPDGRPDSLETWAGWIAAHAESLEVSAPALKWRLVNLKILRRSEAERLGDDQLRSLRPNRKESPPPPCFSRRFVEMIGWGLDQGHVSVRRLAATLGLKIDDLTSLFREHQLDPPFEV